MKKEISWLIANIILMIAFILSSIPLWNIYASQIPNIDEYRIDGLMMGITKDFPVIMTGSEEDIAPAILTIHNPLAVETKGNLLFKYNRLSTLEYQAIGFKINGKLININELLMTSDDEYYIFILKEITLPEYTTENFEVVMWIDPNNHDIFNKYYDYKIELN